MYKVLEVRIKFIDSFKASDFDLVEYGEYLQRSVPTDFVADGVELVSDITFEIKEEN